MSFPYLTLPQKKQWQKSDSEGYEAGREEGFIDGWNECLDEIYKLSLKKQEPLTREQKKKILDDANCSWREKDLEESFENFIKSCNK